ncbi:hypothetical protein [Gordonia oryzae]|nr:hypothetical protein [Gordonia oryzae]
MPTDHAFVRPWQVTFFGRWQIFVLTLVVIGEVFWWVWFLGVQEWSRNATSEIVSNGDVYSYAYSNGWELTAYHSFLLIVSAVAAVLIALDFWIAIAFLRGARGPYIYYTVFGIIRCVAIGIGVIAVLIFYGSGASGTHPDAWPAAAVVGLAVAVNVFFYYLLWCRPSRRYFSYESVALRRERKRAAARGIVG